MLQFDGAGRGQGLLALIPVVCGRCIVHRKYAVEPDRRIVALHDDAESIPLADRPVRLLERLLSLASPRVVPQAARTLAFVRLQALAEVVGIPDLHLGLPAQVNAAVAIFEDLTVDKELEVAEVLGVLQAVGSAVLSQGTVPA